MKKATIEENFFFVILFSFIFSSLNVYFTLCCLKILFIPPKGNDLTKAKRKKAMNFYQKSCFKEHRISVCLFSDTFLPKLNLGRTKSRFDKRLTSTKALKNWFTCLCCPLLCIILMLSLSTIGNKKKTKYETQKIDSNQTSSH